MILAVLLIAAASAPPDATAEARAHYNKAQIANTRLLSN